MIYKQFLFKNRLPVMEQGVQAYAMRQQVIAKNLANATTPNYHPDRVKFEEFFQDSSQKFSLKMSAISNNSEEGSGSGSSAVTPEIVKEQIPASEAFFAGDSHVNIDKEMSDLAENQIKFRFASRMIKRFFSGLNSSITGVNQ